MSKEKQEPPFPVISPWDNEKGMSKRFYAACAAMQGLLANPGRGYTVEQLAQVSFESADELLKQEEL